MSATQTFAAMQRAVLSGANLRKSHDTLSPMREATVEAAPFQTFVCDAAAPNVPEGKSIDLRWAVASTLHFFAGTQLAEPLRRYNRNADRFLTDGVWRGAYGAIAMPQLNRAVQMLQRDPESRRAVVYVGWPGEEHCINRPACWTALHLLKQDARLDMGVYQRSLNLYGVMPYDCINLTCVLRWAARCLGLLVGQLHWTVGSLHVVGATTALVRGKETNIDLPTELLTDPAACWSALVQPARLPEPYATWLQSNEEVRS